MVVNARCQHLAGRRCQCSYRVPALTPSRPPRLQSHRRIEACRKQIKMGIYKHGNFPGQCLANNAIAGMIFSGPLTQDQFCVAVKNLLPKNFHQGTLCAVIRASQKDPGLTAMFCLVHFKYQHAILVSHRSLFRVEPSKGGWSADSDTFFPCLSSSCQIIGLCFSSSLQT
jgi:hypothetical protein